MDSALISTLINLGAGFIVVILIMLGLLQPKWVVQRLLKENDDLKTALALERQRSDVATTAAVVANQFYAAMRMQAEQRGLSEPGQPGHGKDAES